MPLSEKDSSQQVDLDNLDDHKFGDPYAVIGPRSRASSTVPSDQQAPLLTASRHSVIQRTSASATENDPCTQLFQDMQTFRPISNLHTELQLIMNKWYEHLLAEDDNVRWGFWARHIAGYNSETLEKMKKDFQTIAQSFITIYSSEKPADKTQKQFLLSQISSICDTHKHDLIYNLLRIYAHRLQRDIKQDRITKTDGILSGTNADANELTRSCIILSEQNADLVHKLSQAEKKIASDQLAIANKEQHIQIVRSQNNQLEQSNKVLQSENTNQKELILEMRKAHESRMQKEIERLQAESERESKRLQAESERESKRLQEQFTQLEAMMMERFEQRMANLESQQPSRDEKPEDLSKSTATTKPSLF